MTNEGKYNIRCGFCARVRPNNLISKFKGIYLCKDREECKAYKEKNKVVNHPRRTFTNYDYEIGMLMKNDIR